MAVVSRALKYLRYVLIGILALAIGAVGVLTLTQRGRDNLAAMISDIASSPSQTITISGLTGIWSGHLGVGRVVIADGKGPWLAISGLQADWSPLALITRTVKAERLHADRIELARLPDGGESSGGGGSGLPVSLDIAAIDLPAILLDGRLAGEIARISATGSLAVARSTLAVSTDLAVARADGKDGRLDAKIVYDPDESRLDVALNGAEPADGVIANLLDIDGRPAVDISVTGGGPVSDWEGEGTLALDGKVVTRVSGRHQTSDKGSHIEASGAGAFEAFLPEGLRPLVRGSTEFAFAGTIPLAGGIEIDQARLQSDAIHVGASGSINPEGVSDLTLEAKAAGAPVALAFGGTALSFDAATVRAFGAGQTPGVDASVSLAALSAGPVSASGITATLHSDEFDVIERKGDFSLNLAAASAGATDATLAGLLAGTLEGVVTGTIRPEKLEFEHATVKTGSTGLAASGFYSLADGSADAKLKAEFLSGVLPAAARKPLGRTVAVSADLGRATDGALSVSGLEISSGGLSASGGASLADDTVKVELSGALADVAALSPDASGAAAFALSASGPLSAPQVSFTADSDRLVTAGRAIEGLKLAANGTADPDNPAGSVTLAATVEGQKLTGGATLKTTNGQRMVDDLALSLGDNKVSGSLLLDNNFLPSGTVELSLPDLEPLAALALAEVKGAAKGTLRFANDGSARVVIDLSVPSFARGELSGRDIAVKATVADYVNKPVINGTVAAKEIVSGTTVVSGVAVDLSQDGDWTVFSGKAAASGIPADAKGRVKLADGTVLLDLDTFHATVAANAVALAKPTRIAIADGVVRLDGLTVAAAGGNASVSGTAGEMLDLDVKLAALPASVANSFVSGLGATGTLSGSARVTGKASDPKVAFKANWANGGTSQTVSAGFGLLSVSAEGNFAGNLLSVQASLADGSGLGMKGGGTVAVAGSRALNLGFSGAVPFDFLARMLAAQGLSLKGAANVNLKIGGTTSSPAIAGTVTSSGARFVDAGTGIAINDLAMKVSLADNVATVETVTGTLSTGGALSASGTVGIDAARGFPANLSVKLVNGRYTDGRLVTANLDGKLDLSGPLTGQPLIAGIINLGKTVVTVPENLPASLAELAVEHRNASAAVASQEEAIRPAKSGDGGGGVNLDVQVNAPQQIFVQGRGLNAELGGSLRLTGPASAPNAIGKFTLLRGRMDILGRRLDFTSGSISFSGSLVPYLDLAADSTVTDATVTVKVSGPANNPAFSFSSSPTLPEDEILARLVFGKAMSGLSALQIAQLASAAATLAGVGGSTSLLDKLRAATGVDDIDVKTDEDTGDTSVAVGKYLNDKTYLTIEKGATSGSGKATIDLNVGGGVKLRGEATETGKTKGGIFFEKDY